MLPAEALVQAQELLGPEAFAAYDYIKGGVIVGRKEPVTKQIRKGNMRIELTLGSYFNVMARGVTFENALSSL